MNYVIAADGGNSKTDLVVATTDGAVLSRVSGTGTRPHRNGLPATVAGLAELSRNGRLAAGLRADDRVAVASFYLANVDFDDEEAAMFAELTALEIADRLEIRNDTMAVLKAGCPRGWGIAAVGGAGINAVGMHPDGRQERFLGIGAISGDWGGGWSVAEAAFGAAVRAGDARGPDTALRSLIASTFGLDPDAAAIAANRGEITEAEMFAFAPAVFRVAADGDPVAVAIVERFADEVLDFIAALIRRMALADSDVDVVLGGGTLQSRQPQLLARIAAGLTALAPKARLHVLDVAPVAGPLVSALALAGAEPAAIDRARSSLRT
jgi:N-acetylglucosamine kinase-like BadF-type ATPase